MFSLFLLNYRNTCESLGKLKKSCENNCVMALFSRSISLSRSFYNSIYRKHGTCFLWIYSQIVDTTLNR